MNGQIHSLPIIIWNRPLLCQSLIYLELWFAVQTDILSVMTIKCFLQEKYPYTYVDKISALFGLRLLLWRCRHLVARVSCSVVEEVHCYGGESVLLVSVCQGFAPELDFLKDYRRLKFESQYFLRVVTTLLS